MPNHKSTNEEQSKECELVRRWSINGYGFLACVERMKPVNGQRFQKCNEYNE